MRGDGRLYRRANSTNWWMSYCHNGKEVRESTGTTDATKARKLLRERTRTIANERDGIQAFLTPKASKTTIGDLLDTLEQDYRIREKLTPATTSHLKRLRGPFGAKRARALESTDVDTWIEEQLEAGLAPATINRSTQLLTQAFTLGLLQKKVTSKPHIRKLPEQNTREGFFEHDEFEQVLNHLPDYLQDMARFAYHTGWRAGELKQITWHQVDRRARTIHLSGKQTKNGRPRKLALEGTLWTIIETRWKDRTYEHNGVTHVSTTVFHRNGQPIGDYRKAWKNACKTAGLPEKLFHDLRRTAIRNMVRAGVPETVAMRISGHRTRAIFDRYNITSEDDIRDAITRTQEYLAR